MTSLDFRNLFLGLDIDTPILGGGKQPYINFDNSASTPPFKAVQEAINNFMPYYSSVHRGTGFKSKLSTHIFEEARQKVLDFVGADSKIHTCIFVKNTTEAINKLSRRFPFTPQRNLVLTTAMEHHSNDLPWRYHANAVHIKLLPDGRLDMEDFDAQVTKYADQIALVSISGGSNVTGFINPIDELAEKAHAVGAQFMVDSAQLAPHRKINMRNLDDPSHIDYLAISAHKLYAPYGSGALIGRLDTFE
ncbi:MAG: cysteine desulfurase, partial [Chloroflexota bacterium]